MPYYAAMNTFNRRDFVLGSSAFGLLMASRAGLAANRHAAPVHREADRLHDEAVARLQDWIRNPTIAAEGRNVEQGADYLIRLLRDAGFQEARRMPTDGVPGVFATLDAGAKRTLGVYFMYDVKQANPDEWLSPPWEAKRVDLPDIGNVVMGRGATNQKGPESAFLAALHAFRAAGRKLPVNLVLVAEGEEEIGSPHFHQVVRAPEVAARLAKTEGVMMPMAGHGLDGNIRPRRQHHDQSRRQGRGRTRTDRERRALGPWPGQGRALEPARHARQSLLPPGAGAQLARER